MTSTLPRRLVSVAEAAGILGVHRSSIYESIRRGMVKPLRVSAAMKLDLADIDALIAASKISGAPILGRLDKGKTKH